MLAQKRKLVVISIPRVIVRKAKNKQESANIVPSTDRHKRNQDLGPRINVYVPVLGKLFLQIRLYCSQEADTARLEDGLAFLVHGNIDVGIVEKPRFQTSFENMEQVSDVKYDGEVCLLCKQM